MRSVTTEIAMFVFSMPNNVKLAATAMAAIESAQCEPFHFASQFEHDAKYVDVHGSRLLSFRAFALTSEF